MNDFSGEIVLVFHDGSHPELRDGQPCLFIEYDNEVRLFEEPTEFLYTRYIQTGSTPSVHTWSKAAYSLKTWFQYLQALKEPKHWLDASRQDRLDFRDAYLTSISPRTGQTYGTGGVADSMTVVRNFYQFAKDKGWYFGDLGNTVEEEVITVTLDSDTLAHTRSTRLRKAKDRDLPKVRSSAVIHPLTLRNLKNLIQHIGPQASNRKGDNRCARDRLICDLGWVVGLRLAEVVNLTSLQFLNLNPDPNSPYTDMQLTISAGAKGCKTRQVAIPTWLAMDAIDYIEGERSMALRQRKDKPRHPLTQLLLGRFDSPYCGRPISEDAIQKLFREACLAIGLVETIQKTDPGNGEIWLDKVAKHSYHDLRHTYAVLTYHAEVANGNSEPWKKIQAQLGHKYLKTTIDTYLAHVEIFTDQPGLLNVRKMIGLDR